VAIHTLLYGDEAALQTSLYALFSSTHEPGRTDGYETEELLIQLIDVTFVAQENINNNRYILQSILDMSFC
jgi:hypothetical protein